MPEIVEWKELYAYPELLYPTHLFQGHHKPEAIKELIENPFWTQIDMEDRNHRGFVLIQWWREGAYREFDGRILMRGAKL